MDLSSEYSMRFDELRKNRVETSYFKYGSAKKNFSTGNVNASETMKLCVDKYKETGNTEFLVDASNYLMFEFMYPQHEKAYFRATDSSESAGIVGISEKEMEHYRNDEFKPR